MNQALYAHMNNKRKMKKKKKESLPFKKCILKQSQYANVRNMKFKNLYPDVLLLSFFQASVCSSKTSKIRLRQ
jgi:hypothetical protein